jgi:hypothetical protein
VTHVGTQDPTSLDELRKDAAAIKPPAILQVPDDDSPAQPYGPVSELYRQYLEEMLPKDLASRVQVIDACVARMHKAIDSKLLAKCGDDAVSFESLYALALRRFFLIISHYLAMVPEGKADAAAEAFSAAARAIIYNPPPRAKSLPR